VIRFSVLYPTTEGAAFDHDYYRDTHVPMALQAWGLQEAEIDRGIDGPYVAAVHLKFDSMDAMGEALASPDTAAVMADVPNFTTIVSVLQISETA
jgi:uncharacterized protein (TIGR02118 family)